MYKHPPLPYSRRRKAWLCLWAIVLQIIAPLPLYALTSGPSSPEFASFTPVATTKMVNEFTGDFTYNLPLLNIPGANGGGYPLSLSYNNETSVEAEASWVGLGWTLNPGSIQRNKRGFPDDWQAENVTYWNKVPDNWTIGLNPNAGLEVFSGSFASASVSGGIRYNNYRGFGFTGSVGFSFGNGVASLGLHFDNGVGSFSAGLSPVQTLSRSKKDAIIQESKNPDEAIKKINKSIKGSKDQLSLLSSGYGLFTYGLSQRAVNSPAYDGVSTK
ncbi:MAG: hypothetical protein AAFU67_18830, partial [Bacteroidota bacterium]